MQEADPFFDIPGSAQRLAHAHRGSALAPHAQVTPPDAAGAYAVQDLLARTLGPIGGWKVGAAGPAAEPACAPLLAAGVFKSGVALVGPPWRSRGVEVEVALRLGHDLVPGNADTGPLAAARVIEAVDAILPAVEIIETRLADWRSSSPLAQLADLQNHGGLVIGEPSPIDVRDVDLRTGSRNTDGPLLALGDRIDRRPGRRSPRRRQGALRRERHNRHMRIGHDRERGDR